MLARGYGEIHLGDFHRIGHDLVMSISSRHRGVVYTPPAIAERIVDQVLGDVSTKRMRRPLNILDPACGDGSFLRACADWFSSRGVQANLCGIDIDEEAIATAQQQMPTARLCVGNALISPDGLSSRTAKRCQAIDWQAVFPEVAKRGGFDVVVGNPPYVNIRRIHQSHDAEVKLLLRERFQTATGNFDLYVLFFERALQWLRPKGRFAMIVPNKIATLDYAQACRKLLLTQTRIDRVSDLANARVFPGACVYPYVLQFTKVVASQDHQVAIDRYDDTTQFSKARPTASTTIAQQSLDASGFQWSGQGIEVEQRVATAAMSDLATLHSGTTGFAAHQLAKALVDCNDDGNSFPFIVSGNIDRYSLRHGQVRFMNKFFARPTLPQQSSAISDRKRQMFSQPKITIAGMTRRLEAAWSRQPLALGVQVYAATEFKIEPLYVLGLLNSKLMTFLFRQRFAAKQLSGGFMSVNKGQLSKLPIRTIEAGDRTGRRRHNKLISLVERRMAAGDDNAAVEQAIDSLVFKLYDLTTDEMEHVEQVVDELE